MDAAEQYAALERFILDNPDLERLESLSPRFNLFEVMGLSRQEGVHSQFLTWLLSPQENHGLGDDFLKRFLLQTLTRARQIGIKTAAPLEVVLTDFAAAQVYPEWHNEVDGQRGSLDILILDERQKFYCAIENKVGSGEHSQQLTRYRLALEQNYPAPDFRQHYVFLSPGGTSAQDVEERAYWTPVDYNLVCELVEETDQSLTGLANEDLRVFLRHYADILRRHVLDNSEIRQLARTIYIQHRDAIELIYQHKPDYQMEVKGMLAELIDERKPDGWVLHPFNPNARTRTRFYPKEWEVFSAFHTGKSWGGGTLVSFEVFLERQTVGLHLCIGGGENESIRQSIDACIRTFDDLDNWSKEYRPGIPYLGCVINKVILDASDIAEWDEESIRRKIDDAMAAFAQNQYPKIRDAVTQCFREFEASDQP